MITASLFEAHLKCPTKCFLRSVAETGHGNDYADWVRTRNEQYRDAGVKRLIEKCSKDECAVGPLEIGNLKAATWKLAVDLMARGQNLDSIIHAVERIPSGGHGQAAQFIPIRFVSTNKLTQDDQLLLGFDALVLSEALGREVCLGKIIHGDDCTTLKVKTSALAGKVRKLVGNMATLLSKSSPPDLVLNRHCAECAFRGRCQAEAEKTDNLSLLDGVTEKIVRKYAKKGIFTVTQMSYTYRPRRHKHRARSAALTHKPELRALALRTGKICVVQDPSLPRNPVRRRSPRPCRL